MHEQRQWRTGSARRPRSWRGLLGVAALLTAGLSSAALAQSAPRPGTTSASPGAGVPQGAQGDAGPLHVPSPDWRDQVIYFLMIDRFDDGDPSNNDQGAGEFDPADGSRFSGGDLRGVLRRLDYIRDLGATAVWVTPPVANQWLNPGASYGGYHGYWAEDFSRIDAHFGSLSDYQALSRALHGAGMYLVQDVVVNHVGDWLDCDGAATPTAAAPPPPQERCRIRPDPRGRTAPSQSPFDLNDPRQPAHRAAGVYHWTPEIADFQDRRQELDHALAGLDDLDTENQAVRDALRASYGMWIREAGVDAFRVDTAFHVPASYFADFLHVDDPEAPGIEAVARATGRGDFLSFGEGFGSDKPFADAQARKLQAYMDAPGGLPSMINFPLYGTLGDVFSRGRPTAELAHRIGSMTTLHRDPHRMPSFIDNHDVDRFLAGGSVAGMKQALLAMLTLPGIPVIYYGTEQALTGQRTAMFAGGFGSDEDRFDPQAPMYRYLQEAIGLRRGHRLFSRGTTTVLASNAAAAGALAYRVDHGGEAALVVFNTSDRPALLDRLDTGMAGGAVLAGLFGIDGTPAPLAVAADGTVTLRLPPRSGQVWRAAPGSARNAGATAASAATGAGAAAVAIALDTLPSPRVAGDFIAGGTASGATTLELVVDGDLSRARSVPVQPGGRWAGEVRVDAMTDPAIVHRLVAYDPVTGTVSDAQEFSVDLDWQLRADVADPAGDDTGPRGDYTYPEHPSWREARPGDIRRVRAWTAGGALRFEVTLPSISTAWNPANGFDHVAITAYLQLPGLGGGAQVMPLQHADLPDEMRWHRRIRAHGWSSVLTAAEGAAAEAEGRVLEAAPGLAVDGARGTITFTLPATALDAIESLEGARLHVTTWDYDGGYRPLAGQAGPTTFGGGASGGPKVMDAATVTLER